MKNLIVKFDRYFLSGLLIKKYIHWYEMNFQKLIKNKCSHSFNISYKKNETSLLSVLCDKYGSDKGSTNQMERPYPWPPHNYADFYERLFARTRLDVKGVFECGLGTNNPALDSSMGVNGRPGASLRVWRDYFPNAIIVGADIDESVLFEEDRIHTVYVDQTSPKSISNMWDGLNIKQFDLIIDDGLHTFLAGITLFENSIDYLSDSGIYIIEDVNLSDLLKFQEYFESKNFLVDYIVMNRPGLDIADNNLLVIYKNLR